MAIKNKLILSLVFILISGFSFSSVKKSGRGFVAVAKGDSCVYLGWRILPGDKKNTCFDIYKRVDGGRINKLNISPVRETSDFTDKDVDFSKKNEWLLYTSGKFAGSAFLHNSYAGYLPVKISRPAGGILDGRKYCYYANDASAGDLDGDGEYEIVLKWQPSNAKRPPQRGFAANTYLDAYKLNGKFLWRIDLGRNIRSGAAYTQFLVADFDGDGKAEVCCKTGNGTVDGEGNIIGDSAVDLRRKDRNDPCYGKIVDGKEFISVFDGLTGRVIDTKEYVPTRYPLDGWGGIGGNGSNDSTGGRSDRFTACVASLDGKHLNPVMIRGWYGRTVVAAWKFKKNKLSLLWTFDSSLPEWKGYSGMGNHNVSVADFDDDGCDEICVGSMTVDNDGEGLYTTGLRHGDALHAGDLIPFRPGKEVFGIHENEGSTVLLKTPGAAMFDGATGKIIWEKFKGTDIGRGVSGDIDPRYDGSECWTSRGSLYDCMGNKISERKPFSCNFVIRWDSDPLCELLDGTSIYKWNWNDSKSERIFHAAGAVSINGTKANPCLVADILGDWREEVIYPSFDMKELRIYVSTIPAQNRMVTLMADRQYRMSVAWQNVGYNQPTHLSFDLFGNFGRKYFNRELFKTYWTVEAEKDYDLKFNNDTLQISTAKGFTLWFNRKIRGNCRIEYSAMVANDNKKGDRLSDLNCFWMARDTSASDFWQRSPWRHGVFGKYYSLNLYYLGYGGNNNTTTRFRKYDGRYADFVKNRKRPEIITEYTDRKHLLKPNHWYKIKIICKNGVVRYYIDGKKIVDYKDKNMPDSGYFGFRTTKSRVKITGFNYYLE